MSVAFCQHMLTSCLRRIFRSTSVCCKWRTVAAARVSYPSFPSSMSPSSLPPPLPTLLLHVRPFRSMACSHRPPSALCGADIVDTYEDTDPLIIPSLPNVMTLQRGHQPGNHFPGAWCDPCLLIMLGSHPPLIFCSLFRICIYCRQIVLLPGATSAPKPSTSY